MNKRSNSPVPARSNCGFTLIEILVVLVIVTVMVGAAAYALNGTEQHRLKGEASNLMNLLNHLADQSLMKQQTLGWQYDPEVSRCRVLYLDRDQEWRTSDIGKRICTLKTAASVSLGYSELGTMSDSETEMPDLIFYSSGEYVPFSLSLQSRSGRQLQLAGDGINTIALEPSGS